MFSHIRKSLTILALLVCASGVARAQNHTQTLSVTNSPLTITADGNYTQILVRENSATPTAVFSITLAGSATALNYPAGTQFIFNGNFTSGQAIGTIQATTSGPFTFVAVEATSTPSQSVKNTINSSGGGSGTVTSVATSAPLGGGPISTTGTITCVTCALTTNGGTLTATAPVTISAAGVIAITGVAGEVLAGASPAFTATPVLGVDGSAAGTLQLANSAAAFHTILGSVATANNTVNFFATAPTTGDLVDCVTVSTTCTLTDSGVLASALVTASSTNTFTNKSLSANQLTGASAATTLTEGAAGDVVTFAGIETIANLTTAMVIQNTNSTNNDSTGALTVANAGTGTGGVTMVITQPTTDTGDILDLLTGCTVTAGVRSGCATNPAFAFAPSGILTIAGTASSPFIQSVSGAPLTIESGQNLTLESRNSGNTIFVSCASCSSSSADLVQFVLAASGTGNIADFENSSNSKLAFFNSTGQLSAPAFINNTSGHLLISGTAPTISSGFGTSPSIANQNGTAAFTINVGTGGSATSGVIGLPTANTGWSCQPTDITTTSSTVFMTKQTASSATSATIGNFNDTGTAAAWTASDVLSVSCHAY